MNICTYLVVLGNSICLDSDNVLLTFIIASIEFEGDTDIVLDSDNVLLTFIITSIEFEGNTDINDYIKQRY